MTILATTALLRDALEERAALTAVRAGFWQNMGLLSLPSLDSDVSVARSTLQVCSQKAGGRKGLGHVTCSHGLLFLRPKTRVPRLLHVFVVNANHYACKYYHTSYTFRIYMMSNVCLPSANHALLVLLRLVRPRSLPAHPLVAPPQRPILLSKHMRPLRRRHTPLPPRKLRPPVVLACLRRWLPPQVPSPSGQLSDMASLRCSSAAALSLHL